MRAAGRGTSRRIERYVMLFPDPDSPTRPSVSPSATAKETPSTALIVPQRVTRCVRRSRTSMTGAVTTWTDAARSELAELGVERVAQPVAEQVESEHDQEDGEPGKARDPP